MPVQTDGALSPFLRVRRFRAARPYLAGRVLDYGCGVGTLAEAVPADRYVGVDVDDESLAAARARFPEHTFVGPDELDDSSDAGSFDTAVALAVVEHVRDPGGFLAALCGRLRPGGRVVVRTPSPRFEWLHEALSRVRVTSRHGAEDHEQLLDLGELRDLAAAAGLEVVEARRFLLGMNQLVVAAAPA